MRVSEEWYAEHQAKQQARGSKDTLQEIIEARGFTPSPSVSKYRNKKTEVDGIMFDSAKEARRYSELKLMEKAGEISCLERQRVFLLAPSVTIGRRKKPALKYIADFYYFDRALGFPVEVIEDVKSKATAKLPVFRIKQHLMKHIHGVEITLI